MREAHRERFGDLSFAVGGYSTYTKNGKRIDGDMDKWTPNVEAVYATIKFARDTKRLDYTPSEADASQSSQFTASQ